MTLNEHEKIAKSSANQVYEIRKLLIECHGDQKLKELERKSSLKSIQSILFDWLLIFFSTEIALNFSIIFFPFCLIIIGSRQRALTNLIHSAAHRHLFANLKRNDLITNLFAAMPMGETVRAYRTSHSAHHRYLGSEGDPDYRCHLQYGYDDRNPPKLSALRIYLKLFFNPYAWRDSVLGDLLELPVREVLQIISWWSIFLGIIHLVFGSHSSFYFASLWLLARATTYHGVRLLAEFFDHSGLQVGTIAGFTRNLPTTGLTSLILYPHADMYHLTHHLIPSVPFYNLKRTHRMLWSMPDYQNLHHCDSYLNGAHPVVHCWTGKCGT